MNGLLRVQAEYDRWQESREFHPLAQRSVELTAFTAGWHAALRYVTGDALKPLNANPD